MIDANVFPTLVGVFRLVAQIESIQESIPHAGGGVPVGNRYRYKINWYSPRWWGCSRGQGRSKFRGGSYSPRWWGCSEIAYLVEKQSIVFPTLVGVFRVSQLVPWRLLVVFPTLVGVFRY